MHTVNTNKRVMCPYISHLITKHINRVYAYKKKALFIKAAVNGLAFMTRGDDGEEANRGKVGDTLINQFHI